MADEDPVNSLKKLNQKRRGQQINKYSIQYEVK